MKLRHLPLFAALLFPVPAKADIFLWQHEKTGLTITFPDTWKTVNNANPDTVLTIVAPSEKDAPVCRVDVRDGKRYTIFPAKYGDAVQKVAVSSKFWQDYYAQYDNQKIDHVYDGAGLGRWFASYALASYNRNFGTVLQTRRSIAFASLYNDKLYILECSTLNHAYERWAVDFKGIIKSVDFKKAYHELPTGEYQNFLTKAETYFWAQTGPEGTTAY
jgi:hypothetical protein